MKIGVDIIPVARIITAIEKHGDRFLRRIYTQAELDYTRGDPGEAGRPLGRQGGGPQGAWRTRPLPPDVAGGGAAGAARRPPGAPHP